MISKEEVKHIAKLARIELKEEEVEKMQKDLSSILDYFEVIKSAKLKSKSKIGKKIEENILRKDEASSKNLSFTNNLVARAPDKKDGYIKVKSIL